MAAVQAGRRAARRRGTVGALLLLWVILAGCGSSVPDDDAPTYPGTPAGAAQLAEEFLRPGANVAELVARLRPTDRDYAAVFSDDTLVAALRHYGGYWQTPRVLGPNSRQTEFAVQAVTTEELARGGGASTSFPGLYRDVAPHLAPGLTIYQIVFREPGSNLGTTMDGFIHVNGAWRIFPTPWAVLSVDEPGHQH